MANARQGAGLAALAGAGVIALVAVWGIDPPGNGPVLTCTLVFDAGQRLANVPLAATDYQRRRGLARRPDAGGGMLFSWPDSAERVFGMRETLVPLTVAFLDETGRIFQMEDMPPGSLGRYPSDQPARDALELPQGGFQVEGIQVGSRLVMRHCGPSSQ